MKVSDMLQHLLYQLGIKLRKRKMSPMRREYAYLKKRVEVLESLLKEKTLSVDRAKSIFLKNLYHEIRTPLNSIVGFSDLIERNNLTTEDKTVYISHIRESSKEFLQKMDNIIDASILEAGLLKLSKNACSIHNLVSEIYAYFAIQKRISEKQIAFLLNLPEDSKNLKILCDSCRITQVLTNLLSNAFKFTKKGTVEMGYTIKGDEIEFFVTDTGIGILDGKENRVFNNFTKLDESDNANEGLGLGLGLSKKLVELMNGRIWYKSNLSQGTSFYFTLPFVPVASQKQPTKKADGKTLKPDFSYSLRRSVVL